jgi:hypothetical protein
LRDTVGQASSHVVNKKIGVEVRRLI